MLHPWHYLPLGLANLLIAHYIRTVFTTSNIPMPCNTKSLNKSPLCWQTTEFTKQIFGMIGAKNRLCTVECPKQTVPHITPWSRHLIPPLYIYLYSQVDVNMIFQALYLQETPGIKFPDKALG